MDISVKATVLEQENNKIVGLATVTFGEQFKVRGIKIIDSQNGYYVDMPSYKSNELTADGNSVYKEVINVTDLGFYEKLKLATVESFHSGESIKIATLSEEEPSISAYVTILDNGSSKAIARLNVANLIQVNNVNIREGENGNTFVAMPSYRSNQVDETTGKTVYKNYCYATTREFSDKINNIVMDKYKESIIKSPVRKERGENEGLKKPSLDENLLKGENKKESLNKATPLKGKKKEAQL